MEEDAGRIIDVDFMRGDRVVGDDMLRSGATYSASESAAVSEAASEAASESSDDMMLTDSRIFF